jgi:ribonuclease E
MPSPVPEPAPVTALQPPPTATPIELAQPLDRPRLQPAPLPVDALLPVLQSAGLALVQTAPERLAEVQARIAAEPRPPRLPRERPVLPPLDTAPLVQVETRN